MSENFKRINILIRPDQYEKINASGLSLSGLVRDLIDDRFSETTITLSVTRESKAMYDSIISNFGISDQELAHYMVEALDKFLVDKGKDIEKLRGALRKQISKQ